MLLHFSSHVSIFFLLLFSTNDMPHILKETSKGDLLGSMVNTLYKDIKKLGF